MQADIFSYSDYKLYLKDQLSLRIRRNSNYSLRAFARDLGVSFSRLSEIFSTTSGLSAASALKISEHLDFNKLETDYFVNLVLSAHSRNTSVKSKAQVSVKKNLATRSFKRYSEVSLLSKWYYAALVELLCLNQNNEPAFLASVLRVSEREITKAISELTAGGVIECSDKGRWSRPDRFIKVESTVPSERIRAFHESMIHLAANKIQTQPIADRKYLSSVFSVKASAIEEARIELEEFNRSFLQKYSATSQADKVYGFCLQLFHLNESKPS